MFQDGSSNFAAVALIFFVSGWVKGILGLGLPTVAMGLLGLVMPVAAAASLMSVPSLVTNVWQAAAGPSLARIVARLWTVQVGILTGLLATAWLLPHAADTVGRTLLGACLAAYGILGLGGLRLPAAPPQRQPVLGLAMGAATGALTAVTGVFVLPVVPYLQSIGLAKDDLTQALGLCFTTSTLALAAMLALRGHLDLQASAGSALMVLPALAGMWVGQRVRGVMSESLFRRCFYAGLLALGAWLVLA